MVILSVHILFVNNNFFYLIFQVLNCNLTESTILELQNTEVVRLSLLSAIVTVVPAEQLFTLVGNDAAIVILTQKILDIGDRYVI